MELRMIFQFLVYSIIMSLLASMRIPARKASLSTSHIALKSTNDPIGELSPDEDEALIQKLESEVYEKVGVSLDQLINPSKVVNLARDLVQLQRRIESGYLSGEESIKIKETIEKKQTLLEVEKISVMRGWLKNLFVGQSVLAGLISLLMVYNAFPGIETPLSVQVLGFWMWWLFIIPSLRARKPSDEEKSALNLAFLATPVVSVAMPFATKDTAVIWWADAAAVFVCYAYAYAKRAEEGEEGVEKGNETPLALPPLLIKAFKALDYGSGQERGARK